MTADELDDEALALEQGAKAARHDALEDFVRVSGAVHTRGDEAGRRLQAARAAVEEARTQVADLRGAVTTSTGQHEQALAQADAARAQGQFKEALEHDEAALTAQARVQFAADQLARAEEALQLHDAELER